MENNHEKYYRPPSELNSFIVRVAEGCPHNACTFCDQHRGKTYRPLPVEDVLAGITGDARENEALLEAITSMYLEGGDPLALPVENLLRIMAHARRAFPRLTRFACYATARSVTLLSPHALKLLAEAGLRRVFIGLESGLDAVLKSTCKGCSREDLLVSGVRLADAGIENDVSMMLGIGGRELSGAHALATAEVLNAIRPICVRIRTFVPKPGTPLADDCAAGRFALQTPQESLRELRLLVEHINSPMQLLSEHWTDFLRFSARMPEAKEQLAAAIDNALQLPEERFAQSHAMRSCQA